jgi:hypothetical protein
VPNPILAPSFAPLVALFADCFTAPSFITFQHLLGGWVLCLGRHTVTGVLHASGAVGQKHHTSFHRFFRAAAWSAEDVGLRVLGIVMLLIAPHQRFVAALDDTLGRHTGKRINGASMHHDPLLSTRAKPVFHWGHVWVVLAVVVFIPAWDKSFALPVMARLYRSKKLCLRENRPFLKKTELAALMLGTLARALRGRQFTAIADAAYANASVIKSLPPNVHFIGRSRLDAALYARPVRKRMGRPRVKGRRLPSPGARARSTSGWTSLNVDLYDKKVTIQVKTFEALWYVVGGGRVLRFVLVRGWPGHEHDDVFVSTDVGRSARDILSDYCLRWSLEVTFEEVKGRLGFEDPQNRTELAVERTAPMALWVYALTVVWYVIIGQTTPGAQLRKLPWYKKTIPAFSDMLAALRRETWRSRLLDPARPNYRDQKSFDSLLDAVGYAA